MPWAKKDKEGNRLPLIEHLLDVAECFLSICRSAGYARALARAAGRDLDEADLLRLAVLAALHDIGKLNANFQEGNGGHLSEGQAILCDQKFGILQNLMSWADKNILTQPICGAVSHHGRPVWQLKTMMQDIARELKAEQGIAEYATYAMSVLQRTYPDAFGPVERPLPANPQFWHLFTGLLTIADQLGSSVRHFPILRDSGFVREADMVTAAHGLNTDGAFPQTALGAAEIFGWPAGAAPTPLQNMMEELPLSDRLILVESETGSGKTEAAMLRFRRLAEAGAVHGMYFALPTRSSAVQIQRRINDASERLWGLEAALAVPGYLVFGSETGQRSGPFDVVWDERGRTAEARWSIEAPRKYLAAPIAVGTVDQALAAVVKRKWAHMRGAALSRSLLVVDEVHASDFYMNALLIRLLQTHLALGGHVLLMSATLTSRRRTEIFEACGASPGPIATVGYPAVTSLHRDEQQTRVLPAPAASKSVNMRILDCLMDTALVAEVCADAYRSGGRVLVIRNSVRGAVALFEEMRKSHPDVRLLEVNGRPTLHHSRYCAADRKALDAAVEAALGKGSAAPVVVIGTQTLEQSLDIDADLLITDNCPIDVLLQRIGRLHRHPRSDRPQAFRTPSCTVLTQTGASAEELRIWAQIGHKKSAYPDKLVTDETARMIGEMPVWHIPAMNRELVDRGARDDLCEELSGAEREGRRYAMINIAEAVSLDWFSPITDTDNLQFIPEHSTRLGDPGLSVRLENGPESPLGTGRIHELQIPSWMLGLSSDNDPLPGPAITYPVNGGFGFRIGLNEFSYLNSGLEKIMRKSD